MAGKTTSAPSEPAEERLDFKKILPIFLIVLVDLLGMTIIIPLMPLYATSFGANALVIGFLGAVYPIFQFIGAPVLGRLSDRYGRKPILLISQLGTLVGFLFLGFANSLWLIFLSRMIDGISGANISTAQAAVTDSTTEKNRTQGLGLIGAAFGLGFVLGPIIAFISLAVTRNNYHAPAFIAAGFSMLSILLTWFLFQETLNADQRGKPSKKTAFSVQAMFKAISHPAVGLLLGLIFAQQIAFGGFEQLLSLFTLSRLGLNASGNSVVFVFVGVIVVAVQGGFIGPWSRKYGDRRLIYTGLATLAVGLTLIGLTPHRPVPWYSQAGMTAELQASGSFRTHENPVTNSLPIQLPSDMNTGWQGLGWILAAMVPIAIGGGILQPSINSLITKRVDKEEVGGMLGISASFLSAANAIAPLVFGAIFLVFGPSWPFLLGGLLMGVLWLVAIRNIKPGTEAGPRVQLAGEANNG
jgi:DHA1 family tetracycline resistance protein-like MFS transporter